MRAELHATFPETSNVARLFHLPLPIVIEDHLYADSTPKWAALASAHHFQRAQSFNVPAYVVDGRDVIEVLRVAKEEIAR